MDMDSQALAHFLCKKWLTGSTNCERTSSHERQAGRAKSRIPSRLHLLNFMRQNGAIAESARPEGDACELSILSTSTPGCEVLFTRKDEQCWIVFFRLPCGSLRT